MEEIRMSEAVPPNTTTESLPTVSEPTIPAQGVDYFAGCRVFDVTSNEYQKLINGSKKWDRWNKYFDNKDENDGCKNIRNYLYKNPTKTVVLRNKATQDMVYFKPKNRSEP
jgi:hypothetical protein